MILTNVNVNWFKDKNASKDPLTSTCQNRSVERDLNSVNGLQVQIPLEISFYCCKFSLPCRKASNLKTDMGCHAKHGLSESNVKTGKYLSGEGVVGCRRQISCTFWAPKDITLDRVDLLAVLAYIFYHFEKIMYAQTTNIVYS